ncbi:competence pheromone ComX [Paenibacillus sp. NPDC057934]|uniref:competence pheromone ComX n=1 Tax=Paenibacillus sp. NPDC057934 TaxID=3346282 RepID=UPI0036D995E6
MLKEMFQNIVKNPQAQVQFQSGQLQLAGMTSWERKALMDIIRNEKPENVMRTNRYWY